MIISESVPYEYPADKDCKLSSTNRRVWRRLVGRCYAWLNLQKTFYLINPAEICISGIRCNFNNIAKISTIFDFKWTEVTIDSVKEGSSLLEFVKVQGLKYFIRHHSSGNIEMSVVVPCHLFEVFLDKAIKENPENIFMLIYLNLQVTYVYSNLLKNW